MSQQRMSRTSGNMSITTREDEEADVGRSGQSEGIADLIDDLAE